MLNFYKNISAQASYWPKITQFKSWSHDSTTGHLEWKNKKQKINIFLVTAEHSNQFLWSENLEWRRQLKENFTCLCSKTSWANWGNTKHCVQCNMFCNTWIYNSCDFCPDQEASQPCFGVLDDTPSNQATPPELILFLITDTIYSWCKLENMQIKNKN